MEDKERRLRMWPGWKLDELGDDEVGKWKKFPVGSSISSGGFLSDDLEDEKVSRCIYKCERRRTGKEGCLF